MVEADSNVADYLIYLLHNNVRKSIVYAIKQESGMFASRNYEDWVAKLLEKGQVLESHPGGFNKPVGQCSLSQACYPYQPPAPCPFETHPPAATTATATTTTTPIGAATLISECCDATGVIYGGQG